MELDHNLPVTSIKRVNVESEFNELRERFCKKAKCLTLQQFLALPEESVKDIIKESKLSETFTYVDEGQAWLIYRSTNGHLSSALGAEDLKQEFRHLKEAFSVLKAENKICRDPRLAFYSGIIKSKNGSHSNASEFHKRKYETCVFCGVAENLTMAHLITETSPDELEVAGVSMAYFNPPNYKTPLDTKSPRNFLRLCGTKGVRGSCHDLFDNFRLGLIYDPASQKHKIFSVDPNHDLHCKLIQLDPEQPPYSRLLSLRLKVTVIRFAAQLGETALPLVDIADYSEEAKSVNRDVESDEDVDVEDGSSNVASAVTSSLYIEKAN